MTQAIVWFRRDLRLADNPAMQAALDAGHAPIPVYIHAPEEEAPWAPGAASRTWLHHSLSALAADLMRLGSRLIIRRGPSLAALEQLLDEGDIAAVFWNRLYEPQVIARDRRVELALQARGVQAASFNAALLVEPWTIVTGKGEPYRVFTPFWRKASQRVAGQLPVAAPAMLPAIAPVLASVDLDALQLRPQVGWDADFWKLWQPGEAGAHDLLDAFVDGSARGYAEQRNFPDRTGSSKLSPHLHFGEISPRQICARLAANRWPADAQADLAQFMAELGWREFSHHLLFHFPHACDQDLSGKFARFKWAAVEPELLYRWQHGRTGIPLVDAGMRELWHTGWMHNRVRMLVASFLTKNLRYHWSHGARWFWDALVDADMANNSQGWQWSAGTGADAAPYFRIFNPVTQAERFDRHGTYIRRWLPELAGMPTPALFAPWQYPDLLKRIAPAYPATPMLDLSISRMAALDAYRESR